MTIVTKPLAQEKRPEKALQDDEGKQVDKKSNNLETECKSGSNQATLASDHYYNDCESGQDTASIYMVPSKLSAFSQACFLVTAIFTLILGLGVAMHSYYQVMITSGSFGNRRFYAGSCSLPYHRKLLPQGSANIFGGSALISGEFGNSPQDQILSALGRIFSGDTIRKETDNSLLAPGPKKSGKKPRQGGADGTIELDYEVDLDLDEFESIKMPEFSHGKYFHDFKVNKTAIVDEKMNRCFVLPLDRKQISPPRSFYDIISKMKNGAFELDLEEIRQDTRIVFPAITDLKEFGAFIGSACQTKATFRLEPVPHDSARVTKRSAGTSAEVASVDKEEYVEFAGKMIKYNILNLKDI